MTRSLPILTALALVAASVPGHAVDAENGKVLAQRWCASCHVVAPEQRQASSDAPPFASIAKMPDFNPQKVAFFLLAPHPKMPDMGLSRRDAEDLAAYIAKTGQ
jgi:mono/diheme cytochrome c family protein